MITYEQYAKEFAKIIGITSEDLYIRGLSGDFLEDFAKGYARLSSNEQRKADKRCAQDSHKLGRSILQSLQSAPLIELK